MGVNAVKRPNMGPNHTSESQIVLRYVMFIHLQKVYPLKLMLSSFSWDQLRSTEINWDQPINPDLQVTHLTLFIGLLEGKILTGNHGFLQLNMGVPVFPVNCPVNQPNDLYKLVLVQMVEKVDTRLLKGVAGQLIHQGLRWVSHWRCCLHCDWNRWNIGNHLTNP